MGVAGMFLAQPLLFRSLCYIDGRWVHSNQGSSVAVHNPADQSLLGHVPMLEQSQIEQAVQAAHKAQCLWRYTALNERAGYLHRWAALMVEHRADLAKILSLEQGTPLAEALGEIDYAASFIPWYAEQAKRLDGQAITSHQIAKASCRERWGTEV